MVHSLHRFLETPLAAKASMSTLLYLFIYIYNTCVCAFVSTLIPHGVTEFGEEGQQLCLQANWCQTEAPEQGLCLHAVPMVLYPKKTRNNLQPSHSRIPGQNRVRSRIQHSNIVA